MVQLSQEGHFAFDCFDGNGGEFNFAEDFDCAGLVGVDVSTLAYLVKLPNRAQFLRQFEVLSELTDEIGDEGLGLGPEFHVGLQAVRVARV